MKNFQINPRLLLSEPMVRCKLNQCEAACCIYGVWIDQDEAIRLKENAGIILPEMSIESNNPDDWFDGRQELDENSESGIVVHSRVVESPRHYGGAACIFLREDHKCSIQTAAQKAGMHPWSLKPFYCTLHPLDLDEKGRITLDDTDLLLDEPGSCLRPSIEPIPLVKTFEQELRYFLGNREYEQLLLLRP
jgi:hypothetical protein